MARASEHLAHVRWRGAGVLCGDVAAAQGADEVAVLAIQHAAVARVLEAITGLTRDDALGSAPPQAGQGILASHAYGQAQAVPQQIFEPRVGPVPHAAGALAAIGPVYEGRVQRARLAPDLEEHAFVRVVVPAIHA